MWHEKNTIQTVARIEMKARLNNQNYFGLITQFKSSWSKNETVQLKALKIGDPEHTVLNESPALWFNDVTDRLKA